MAKGKVLVIDDDRNIAELLWSILRDAGFEVELALDGYSGVAAAARARPDVILLDMQMPAGGGESVLARLAGNDLTKAIPVFLCTSLTEVEIRARVPKGAVFAGVFFKPLDLKAVVRRVTETVEKRAG
ncbi:MAG: response regulator [Elusimicrobia bacterium]|nr:response regulator [Elusimicrobiota bacterium]